MNLKVAVYAICKDEAPAVQRWMEHLAEADGVFVADTGSRDDSVELLEACGACVTRCEVAPYGHFGIEVEA